MRCCASSIASSSCARRRIATCCTRRAPIRELAAKRHTHDKNIDGWEGSKILFRALGRGQPKLALPELGGLFAPGLVRDFDDCTLDNRHFHGALFHLAWLRTERGLQRANWRDIETEELGSVYESLLELVPDPDDPSGFGFIEVAGHDRKRTASYYTPDSLAQALLDEALDPLVAERTKDKGGQAAIDALLDLRIVDQACGSGHFLLAAARRLAVLCAGFDKPGSAPTPVDYRHWLREVARRCLFGVDKNPMAIELAKVAPVDRDRRARQAAVVPRRAPALRRCAVRRLRAGRAAGRHPRCGLQANHRRRQQGGRRIAQAQQGRARCKQPGPIRLLRAAPRGAGGSARPGGAGRGGGQSRALPHAHGWARRYRMEVACDLYCAAFLMPKTRGPVREAGPGAGLVATSRDVWDKL